MIEVKKQLTLQSRDGAGLTMLDASVAGFDGVMAVVIRTDGVVFGTPRRGFLITSARRSGLLVQANGVTVASNVAIGNGTNGNDAFDIEGTGNTVSDNVAINNACTGFEIHGDGGIATGNVASDNLGGFEITLMGTFGVRPPAPDQIRLMQSATMWGAQQSLIPSRAGPSASE
jgi:parallel beta-helix repeat protein